jgi:hypothetical protein
MRTMRTTAKRVATGAIAAVVGSLAAVVVAAAPAEAYCAGQGNGQTLSVYYGGHLVAQERQVVGTCDGDGVYNGELRDTRDDGYAARAWYVDGSFQGIVKYAYTSDWVNYTFYDQNGNSSAGIQVWSRPETKPEIPASTWGY